MQEMPEYRDTTTFLITADHGRGQGLEGWKEHGDDVEGSSEIWIAALGPDTPALGERSPVRARDAGPDRRDDRGAARIRLPAEPFPSAAPPLPVVVAEARAEASCRLRGSSARRLAACLRRAARPRRLSGGAPPRTATDSESESSAILRRAARQLAAGGLAVDGSEHRVAQGPAPALRGQRISALLDAGAARRRCSRVVRDSARGRPHARGLSPRDAHAALAPSAGEADP